jgi:hypothetical protein
MTRQHRWFAFPLIVLSASWTLAPAPSRAQLVPPGVFRGKSLAQWSFDWSEWALRTGLGGQTLPDTVDGVRYLPPNLGETFVTNLTISQGTAVAFSPFIVFGENYDIGGSDDPNDPILNDIFAGATFQTKFDGATVLEGATNAFPARMFGPTSFASPIAYATPQPRGPGVNSTAAIFVLGLGEIFDPLPLGQHTIQNTYTSNFFGGPYSATYNITVVPEPGGIAAGCMGVLCLVNARRRARSSRR